MILPFNKRFKDKILSGIKTSTIRENKHGRWKPGRLAHMATGVRTSAYQCFATSIIKETYPIKVRPKEKRIYLLATDYWAYLTGAALEYFITSEGFDSEAEFWEFFPNDLDGTLMIWFPVTPTEP